jgi:hypothetical protein
MIRIYTDESDGLALAIHEKGVEIYSAPTQFVSGPARRRQPERQGIGLITTALLVLLAGGAGYVAAPRHYQVRAASTPPLAYNAPAGAPMVRPIAPLTSPPSVPTEVQRELATAPTVTPPPASPAAQPSTSGPAAFGLQQ